jgi:hypothetical protein
LEIKMLEHILVRGYALEGSMYGKVTVAGLIVWLCRYDPRDELEVGPGRIGHIELSLPGRMPQGVPTHGDYDVEFLKSMRIKP